MQISALNMFKPKRDAILKHTKIILHKIHVQLHFIWLWLVGCFGFNGPLRQYCSLYRASPKEREKEERKDSRE